MQKVFRFLLTFILTAGIIRGIYIHVDTEDETINSAASIEDPKVKKSFDEYSLVKDSLFIHDLVVFSEGWDTLAQPQFWYQVMNTSPDTILVNIAATRKILTRVPTSHYMDKEKKEREAFKDSIKTAYQLPEDEEIYVTFGRKHYYQFKEVLDSLNIGISAFKKEKVNPWYAQVILMIESPNQLKVSPVGAYGGFQLMKRIAIEYGLKVNKNVDERANLSKSATAAAKLIKEVCIPKAKEILTNHSIRFSEKDLWFRLLVLHVYHAGYRNVNAVVKKIKPKEGGTHFIKKLWQTQYRGFKNASQNYSQLALASQISLDKIIKEEYNTEELKPETN